MIEMSLIGVPVVVGMASFVDCGEIACIAYTIAESLIWCVECNATIRPAPFTLVRWLLIGFIA